MNHKEFRDYIINEIDFLEETKNLVTRDYIVDMQFDARINECRYKVTQLNKIIDNK